MDIKKKGMKQAGINKISLPFYEPPPRKTSAEIINEARLAIKESQMVENTFAPTTIKPLQTQRPFTPRDKERLLFGKKVKTNRPPSSFSLRYLQNETDLPTTPPETSLLSPSSLKSQTQKPPSYQAPTTRHHRSSSLSEINESIFNIGVKESLHTVKLPSLESKPLTKRKLFKKSNTSLDNLPEENERVSDSRNAFSSPQERTDFGTDLPYERPSKQSISECLLLGPQNLEKLFDNRQIIENSGTLFANTVEAKTRTLDDVLNDINRESSYKYNNDVVIGFLYELYECMEKEKMFDGKISSKLKIQILKTLYKFVESTDERILIAIAKVILALKVTGNNLSGVCKLIFKVSKNDKNDQLFFQHNLLELFLDALGRSSPLDDAEACIYGYGAVKFLTMNPKLLDKITGLGILELMVLHIKIINTAKLDKESIPEQTHHALFQLTGALRNLVSEELIFDNFISSGAINELCRTMEIFSTDLDVIANISRTLSIISTNDCCCDSLVDYKNIYKIFINLFDKYPGNEEIIVRLTYTLGNIVSKIDNTRVKFFQEENSMASLINIWKIYLERTLKNCSIKLDNIDENLPNTEDVMIKTIRVIANLVINPDIGKQVNEKFGNALIEETLKALISNPFKQNEELVLSVLSTLNNLSYYYTSESEVDIFHIKQVDIIDGITEYTKSRNKECVVETMRILGNLSRSNISRSYITECEVFSILINLLDKVDLTLLKTTIGVFVNLMSDNKSRKLFKTSGGVEKLIIVLKNYCERDWVLGTLVCQTLWNYCINIGNLCQLISESEVQELLVILSDFLDEEKLFGISESAPETDLYVTQEYLIWEEFANVATNLLEKIEYFLDTCDQNLEEKPITKDSSTNLSW
ncbi:unnamed protein product [Brassicogethes aeneus]|uniref:Armadillo repeat-containing protein 2 n=1 Tax=Brassicogethes aeneus TaxID=1431903 RepID=A0A9P0FJX3_BRAAE|nr:unnamed protein product [Brassicogethes aeneus]